MYVHSIDSDDITIETRFRSLESEIAHLRRELAHETVMTEHKITLAVKGAEGDLLRFLMTVGMVCLVMVTLTTLLVG